MRILTWSACVSLLSGAVLMALGDDVAASDARLLDTGARIAESAAGELSRTQTGAMMVLLSSLVLLFAVLREIDGRRHAREMERQRECYEASLRKLTDDIRDLQNSIRDWMTQGMRVY